MKKLYRPLLLVLAIILGIQVGIDILSWARPEIEMINEKNPSGELLDDIFFRIKIVLVAAIIWAYAEAVSKPRLRLAAVGLLATEALMISPFQFDSLPAAIHIILGIPLFLFMFICTVGAYMLMVKDLFGWGDNQTNANASWQTPPQGKSPQADSQ